MSGNQTRFQGGIGGIQFHPVPYLFLKTPPHNNILIGNDAMQIRFVEQLTDVACEARDSLSDDDLFDKDGVLYRLLTPINLDLSPQMRAKTGIWSLAPITSGSAAATALIRAAAEILEEKLSRERLASLSRLLGREFENGEISDLRVGLWETVWVMTGDPAPHHWKEPWESAVPADWMPPGVNLGLRFGTLFKTLKAYVLVQTDAEQDARKLGTPPHKLLKLKELRLNPAKVYETLKELSRWKALDINPKIVALTLTKIWIM